MPKYTVRRQGDAALRWAVISPNGRTVWLSSTFKDAVVIADQFASRAALHADLATSPLR